MTRACSREAVGVSMVILLLAIVAGCSDQAAPNPTPEETHVTLSGRVCLEAKLADGIDTPLGVRRVDDADGVVVHLTGSGGLQDSTATVAGSYTFSDLRPGPYRLAIWVVPGLPDTASVTLADHDLTVADTLVLAPHGEIHNYPNPGEPEGIGTEFTAHSAQTYSMEVRSLSGELIWSFEQAVPPGYYHVHWDGDDETEHVTPAGAYWIIVHVDGREIYGLVFWDHGSEPPSPGNCGHITADGLLLEENGTPIVVKWRDTQRGDLVVRAGDWSPDIHVGFLRADSTAYAIADTCPENHLSWDIADTSVVAVELEPETKWTFRIRGKRAGQTDVTLNAWHEEHIHFSSLPIPVDVAP